MSENERKLEEYFSGLEVYVPQLFTPEAKVMMNEIKSHGELFAFKMHKNSRKVYVFENNHTHTRGFEPHIQKCSQHLYDLDLPWRLHEIGVMNTGHSRPIRCKVSTDDNEEIFYIKEHNLLSSERAFGIELLRYHSSANRNYQYILDNEFIIENHLIGSPVMLNDKRYMENYLYTEGLLEFTLASLSIGLDDIEIFDATYFNHPENYIVNDEGIHIPVDLERLTPYGAEEIKGIHKLMQQRLALSENEARYNSLIHAVYDTLIKDQREANDILIREAIEHIRLLEPSYLNKDHYKNYAEYLSNEKLKKSIYLL